jgi:hypothetical protein
VPEAAEVMVADLAATVPVAEPVAAGSEVLRASAQRLETAGETSVWGD